MEEQRKVLVGEFRKEKERMLSLDSQMRDAQRLLGGSMTGSMHSHFMISDPGSVGLLHITHTPPNLFRISHSHSLSMFIDKVSLLPSPFFILPRLEQSRDSWHP